MITFNFSCSISDKLLDNDPKYSKYEEEQKAEQEKFAITVSHSAEKCSKATLYVQN